MVRSRRRGAGLGMGQDTIDHHAIVIGLDAGATHLVFADGEHQARGRGIV
jgi:hypothetical protein